MEIRMYHIQNTVPILHQIRQAQSVSTLHSFPVPNGDGHSWGHEVSSSRATDLMKNPFPSTKQEHLLWYSGIFGTMTLQKKTNHSKSKNASAEGKAPLVSQVAWTFRTSFISFALQLRYSRSFGHISRSLNIYPVLSRSDTIFELCRSGDLLGLQTALSRKGVSPFVTDDGWGWNLLHVTIDLLLLLPCDCTLTYPSTPQFPIDPRYATGYYKSA